jgi:hypothetical protein
MKNLTRKVFVVLVIGAFASATMVSCAASQGGKKTTDDKPGKRDTIAMQQETDTSTNSATEVTL